MSDLRTDEVDHAAEYMQAHFLKTMVEMLKGLQGEADCRRRQVGAVLMKGLSVVGVGWNALPDGSCLAGECPRGLLSYDQVAASSDYTGNCVALHAETRALADAAGGQGEEWTYGGMMYVTADPCPGCAAAMERAGVEWCVVTWTDNAQQASQPTP